MVLVNVALLLYVLVVTKSMDFRARSPGLEFYLCRTILASSLTSQCHSFLTCKVELNIVAAPYGCGEDPMREALRRVPGT